MTGKARARFWVWWCGSWVLLKLADGESVTAWRGGPTDEGYSSTREVWSRDGDLVRVQGADEGRDCDGRHGHYWAAVCPVSKLRAREAEGGEVPGVPAWEHVGAEQYDEYAEAAGY